MCKESPVWIFAEWIPLGTKWSVSHVKPISPISQISDLLVWCRLMKFSDFKNFDITYKCFILSHSILSASYLRNLQQSRLSRDKVCIPDLYVRCISSISYIFFFLPWSLLAEFGNLLISSAFIDLRSNASGVDEITISWILNLM